MNITNLGNIVKTLFDLHKFINKMVNKVKSSSIFGLTKQLSIAYPKHIPDFLGQIRLYYEEHDEFSKIQQEKL